MLIRSQEQTIRIYSSDVLPDVATENPEVAKTIAFADANPFVWKIVATARSKAFGLGSSEYIGWAQKSPAPEAILERTRHFHASVDPNVHRGMEYRSRDIWGWRARFTFQRFEEEGFTGGYFQRFDGRYDRDAMTLDYTPGTIAQVIRNFIQWASSTPGSSPFDAIKLDGKPLPESTVEAALLLSASIWDPPGEFFAKRGLFSSIR
jgi:hypothetical protein